MASFLLVRRATHPLSRTKVCSVKTCMSQETCGPDLVEESGLVPFWLKGPDINSHHRGVYPTEWWSGQGSLPGIETPISSWCSPASGPSSSC